MIKHTYVKCLKRIKENIKDISELKTEITGFGLLEQNPTDQLRLPWNNV